MSPRLTAPPLAPAVATPPLPADAVNCAKSSSLIPKHPPRVAPDPSTNARPCGRFPGDTRGADPDPLRLVTLAASRFRDGVQSGGCQTMALTRPNRAFVSLRF